MKVTIEHSRFTHTYFVTTDGHMSVTRRKDAAERIAKQAGATEIAHRERNVVRDLVKFSIMSEEAARAWAKEHR